MIFFKLLRRFSHSFSALSLAPCASLEWLHDSKEGYSWQVLSSLSAKTAFPALACSSLSGAPLPPFLSPSYFFLCILSFFLCTHSQFQIFNISFFHLYLIPPTIIPIFQHLIILKFALLISPFLTIESFFLSTQNKMKKLGFSVRFCPHLQIDLDSFSQGAAEDSICSVCTLFTSEGLQNSG